MKYKKRITANLNKNSSKSSRFESTLQHFLFCLEAGFSTPSNIVLSVYH